MKEKWRDLTKVSAAEFRLEKELAALREVLRAFQPLDKSQREQLLLRLSQELGLKLDAPPCDGPPVCPL